MYSQVYVCGKNKPKRALSSVIVGTEGVAGSGWVRDEKGAKVVVRIFLRSFRHHFKTIGKNEMTDVDITQKMIPFVTCKISFG